MTLVLLNLFVLLAVLHDALKGIRQQVTVRDVVRLVTGIQCLTFLQQGRSIVGICLLGGVAYICCLFLNQIIPSSIYGIIVTKEFMYFALRITIVNITGNIGKDFLHEGSPFFTANFRILIKINIFHILLLIAGKGLRSEINVLSQHFFIGIPISRFSKVMVPLMSHDFRCIQGCILVDKHRYARDCQGVIAVNRCNPVFVAFHLLKDKYWDT